MNCSPCALARLTLYLLFTLIMIPPQALAIGLGMRAAARIPLFYHRVCLKLIGMEVRISGAPLATGPAIIVANHASYLDIPVLGSLIEGCFVAKTEVAGWPLFGILARLQRTVFVARRRTRALEQRDRLGERLADGDSLIVFPEGTSSDGNAVLAFKSSLFAVADRAVDGAEVKVQPVSIAATRLAGAPAGRDARALYAWYGDMDLAPHLWQFLAVGKITVDVVMHPPLTLSECGSRKEMARRAQMAVAKGHLDAMIDADPTEAMSGGPDAHTIRKNECVPR